MSAEHRAALAKAFVEEMMLRGGGRLEPEAVRYHLALLLKPEGHPTIKVADSVGTTKQGRDVKPDIDDWGPRPSEALPDPTSEEFGYGFNSAYVRELRRLLLGARSDALALCRAWHGPTFGYPGYGGVTPVSSELAKAGNMIDDDDAILAAALDELEALRKVGARPETVLPRDLEREERAFRDGYESGFGDAQGCRADYAEESAAKMWRASVTGSTPR